MFSEAIYCATILRSWLCDTGNLSQARAILEGHTWRHKGHKGDSVEGTNTECQFNSSFSVIKLSICDIKTALITWSHTQALFVEASHNSVANCCKNPPSVLFFIRLLYESISLAPIPIFLDFYANFATSNM